MSLVEKGQNGKSTAKKMFIVVVKTIPSKVLNGQRQAKKCLLTCEKCADSDNPAHAQSIIRAFALYSHIL